MRTFKLYDVKENEEGSNESQPIHIFDLSYRPDINNYYDLNNIVNKLFELDYPFGIYYIMECEEDEIIGCDSILFYQEDFSFLDCLEKKERLFLGKVFHKDFK